MATNDDEQPQRPNRPVIDVDADPHNANWLRILAERRKREQERQKREPEQQ